MQYIYIRTLVLLSLVLLASTADVNSPCQFNTHDALGAIHYDFSSLSGRGNGVNGLWESASKTGTVCWYDVDYTSFIMISVMVPL